MWIKRSYKFWKNWDEKDRSTPKITIHQYWDNQTICNCYLVCRWEIWKLQWYYPQEFYTFQPSQSWQRFGHKFPELLSHEVFGIWSTALWLWMEKIHQGFKSSCWSIWVQHEHPGLWVQQQKHIECNELSLHLWLQKPIDWWSRSPTMPKRQTPWFCFQEFHNFQNQSARCYQTRCLCGGKLLTLIQIHAHNKYVKYYQCWSMYKMTKCPFDKTWWTTDEFQGNANRTKLIYITHVRS